MEPKDYIFTLSLKTGKFGDYFGKKLYLFFNVKPVVVKP